MKKGLYIKLAFNNIRKNKNTFFPFLIAAISMVSMFYMLMSIYMQSDKLYYGAQYMVEILYLGGYVTGIVAAIIIFYTNSFLMKQRTKELGLYNVLGLEKRHIGKILFWEITLVAVIGMFCGLIIGAVFSKLMFMLFINMLQLKAKFAFTVSIKAVLMTIGTFACIFAVDIVMNFIRIIRLKPVDMMRTTNAGEKEPKAKWLLAIVGVGCLGVAYYMASTVNKPLDAMNKFFIAVILVIIGTYFVFIAASIAILKLMKKNKKFYYHKTHFVTVSGLIYRMKQNAVGLASICILSTMVIVVLSTTVSLYIGAEEEQRILYPRDTIVTRKIENFSEKQMKKDNDKINAVSQKIASKHHVTIEKKFMYQEYSTLGERNGNTLKTATQKNSDGSVSLTLGYNKDTVKVTFMTASDYYHLAEKQYKASDDCIGFVTNIKDENLKNIKSFKVNDKEFPVKYQGDLEGKEKNAPIDIICFLVKDNDQISEYRQLTKVKAVKKLPAMKAYFEYDIKGKKSDKVAFGKEIQKKMSKAKISGYLHTEDYYSSMQYTVGLFASVLFIGIFIGMMFLIATVLIIYYKQISEGFDDQKNFQIMKKIGLAKKEISHIINSQIRMVFALPIAVAVVHIVFAFNIIKKILLMMGLTNTMLFIECTVGTVCVFFAFYMIVYKITSRVYYRLVGQQ